jgi:hypothetical protein
LCCPSEKSSDDSVFHGAQHLRQPVLDLQLVDLESSRADSQSVEEVDERGLEHEVGAQLGRAAHLAGRRSGGGGR